MKDQSDREPRVHRERLGVRGLADLLSSRQEDLLQRWLRLERTLAPESCTESELRDALPCFVGKLIASLRGASALSSSDTGEEHGAQRLRIGFSLEALIREYGLLRACIFDLIDEEGLTLDLRDVNAVSGLVDPETASTAAEYTRQQTAQRVALEHQQRKRLETIVMQEPALVALLRGPKHVYELANPAYLRAVGRNVVGKPIREALPELEGQQFFELLDRVYSTGEPFSADRVTARLARDDGLAEHIFRLSLQPQRDDSGQVDGVLVHAVDVTNQARAERQLERRAHQAELSASLGKALTSGLPLRAQLQRCTDAIVPHLDAAFARIWTLDDTGSLLELQASSGRYTHLDGAHARIKVGSLKIGRIAQERLPHVTNDVATDPEVADHAWAAREGIVSFAGYPLVVEGRLVGVLACFATQCLAGDVLSTLQAKADQIALAIDRDRALKELQRSETRYRLASRATSDAIWDWEVLTDTLTWSEGVETLIGRSCEELASTKGFLEKIHPDDRDRVSVGLRNVGSGSGDRWEDAYRLKRLDGTWARVVDRAFVVRDAAGNAVRVVGAIKNVTEQKEAAEALSESERQFRMLADFVPQFVWIADETGFIHWYNRRWFEYTGTTLDEMKGWGWQRVHAPELLPEILARFKAAFARGETWEDRFPLRGADGQYRWFLSRAMPVRDAHGKIVRWFGTNTDIEDLRRAEAALEERMQFERQLLGIVSHDLRNPLQAVLLGAQSLQRRGTLDERTTAVLGRIRASADRALWLVRDLLDFTQARLGGGLRIEPKESDLAALVARTVDEVSGDYPGRHIEAKRAGDCNGTWDPERMVQMVCNLLTNALKYSPDATPVEVHTRGDGDGVVFTVHNLGEPIASERLPELFEPLQRGTDKPDESRSVGLGLYIVKQVVVAHGGRVEVTSTAEAGTTFTVRLPRGR